MPGDPKGPLSYENATGQAVSRRQFRWLFALVVLNLLLTLQGNFAPGVSTFFKQRWAQYQAERAQAAAVAQAKALEQQALTWKEPPDKVVWDEDTETAAGRLAAQGYHAMRVEGLNDQPLLANWPRGAAAVSPPFVDQVWAGLSRHRHQFPWLSDQPAVSRDAHALLFVHGLKTPSGEQRLVFVHVEGQLSVRRPGPSLGGQGQPGQPMGGSVEKRLRLVAHQCIPGGGAKPISLANNGRATLLIHPDDGEIQFPWTWTPPGPGQAERFQIKSPQTFRFYAGQPDPADPSHFTIDYDLNGKRGTIHGRLKENGRLELTPAAGLLVGARWYPDAPATQPGAKP
jgi:hypothetical protein